MQPLKKANGDLRGGIGWQQPSKMPLPTQFWANLIKKLYETFFALWKLLGPKGVQINETSNV